MPHISKKFLQPEIYRKINAEFIFSLSKLPKAEVKSISSELFTRTERLMLAKRLATIYFLSEHLSKAEIYTSLKISPSTVDRLYNNFNSGKYNLLIKIFRRRKNRETFWNDLEKILQAGLPPRGRGRWKWLHKY